MTARLSLVITPLAAASPDVGRFLWTLEDIRAITKRAVVGMDSAALDWEPLPALNSVGTLLAHIAGVEVGWLYNEVLEQDVPTEVAALLPSISREPDGHLPRVVGRLVAEHLAVLDAVRARLLAVFLPMSATEYRRIRPLDEYDVTPEWCLYHLAEHEAAHRGEIETVRTLAEAAIAGEIPQQSL